MGDIKKCLREECQNTFVSSVNKMYYCSRQCSAKDRGPKTRQANADFKQTEFYKTVMAGRRQSEAKRREKHPDSYWIWINAILSSNGF